jgi:hypothetical protein
MKICKHTGENKAPDFRVDDQGTLWYWKTSRPLVGFGVLIDN